MLKKAVPGAVYGKCGQYEVDNNMYDTVSSGFVKFSIGKMISCFDEFVKKSKEFLIQMIISRQMIRLFKNKLESFDEFFSQ